MPLMSYCIKVFVVCFPSAMHVDRMHGPPCFSYEVYANEHFFCGFRSSRLSMAQAYGENEAHVEMECSNVGTCDRTQGACKCPSGYTGNACQRLDCPNDCSGRGTCMTLAQVRVCIQEENKRYIARSTSKKTFIRTENLKMYTI